MTAFFREGLPTKGPSFYIFVQGGTDSWDSDIKFQKDPALSPVLRGINITFFEKERPTGSPMGPGGPRTVLSSPG